ncbi:SGNH/GDSL hydrolase family protein [sulfur-oxidizing endosymbiont of Gigantopelta aegis]|uniref:SGNH/GDSL hydrolase family protein n=1 Tax=sulfur-oxidizing endosymbiont of Gigantopelta aegis TaxID=2794934 RepID=UPI0018DB1806|nr:SGNH/GDSL hydrolase family protein [sulfur-oxidizing endosymbiont of Gigantopelta aegis]
MKKTIAINILLVLTVVIGTFLFIESFVEDKLITKTPVKFHFALPSGMAILAQSSKSSKIPENYIAIVGDSYAQGAGDWLREIDPNSNDAFNASHVLNQLTGHDVITFGKGGASNITGWVREPISRYQFIERNISPKITEPEIIIAFFYAGNDLLDNVEHVYEKFIPRYGKSKLYNEQTWDDYFQYLIKKKKKSALFMALIVIEDGL